MSKRVTGLGGIFVRVQNPKQLGEWYHKHLDIELEANGDTAVFRWRYPNDAERTGATVWALFAPDSDYLGSKDAPVMLNYRVENLSAVIEALKQEGVEIEMEPIENIHGRFAWIRDPEGHRVELWQAPENY